MRSMRARVSAAALALALLFVACDREPYTYSGRWGVGVGDCVRVYFSESALTLEGRIIEIRGGGGRSAGVNMPVLHLSTFEGGRSRVDTGPKFVDGIASIPCPED